MNTKDNPILPLLVRIGVVTVVPYLITTIIGITLGLFDVFNIPTSFIPNLMAWLSFFTGASIMGVINLFILSFYIEEVKERKRTEVNKNE